MSEIHNNQRRALEALMKNRSPATIVVGGSQRYGLEGKELFLRSISREVETCSDLHGINIAVFSEGERLCGNPTMCSSAVLVRTPLKGECSHDDGIARMVVETLEVAKVKTGFTEFHRTGRKEIYVNTIC